MFFKWSSGTQELTKFVYVDNNYTFKMNWVYFWERRGLDFTYKLIFIVLYVGHT